MPQRRTYVIVFNPTAGRGRGNRAATEIVHALSQRDLDCHVLPTGRRGQGTQLAADAIAEHRDEGELCVVACGGDGTMQEVANAVARASSPHVVMGLAPAGRCNDFAYALGIDADPARIAHVLVDGQPRSFDLGRVGDRYFCTIAALGFDAAVSRFVNEMKMPLRGSPAYVYGTMRELMRYRTPMVKLSGDFGRIEGPVFMAATANTCRYGGAMRIAPQADPTDGLLDVCLVSAIKRRRVLWLLNKVVSGRHVELAEVRMLRTRRLSVEACDANARVEVWADGEPLSQLPVTIESVPNAIRVLVPPTHAGSR